MTLHVIHFSGAINASKFGRLQEQCILAITQQEASRIRINLCTEGGSTVHGFGMYNFLQSLPVPVDTHNIGSVESMGIIVYLAGNVRSACAASRFLIHPLHWNTHGSLQDHSRIAEFAACLDNDRDRYVDVFTERTQGADQPLNVESILNGRASVLTPSSAVSAGLATAIEAMPTAGDAIHWWIHD